jgi:hypothetical protein
MFKLKLLRIAIVFLFQVIYSNLLTPLVFAVVSVNSAALCPEFRIQIFSATVGVKFNTHKPTGAAAHATVWSYDQRRKATAYFLNKSIKASQFKSPLAGRPDGGSSFLPPWVLVCWLLVIASAAEAIGTNTNNGSQD